MKKKTKKTLIIVASILLIAVILFISGILFINKYEKPAKGDHITLTDEIVDFKPLSDGLHTIAVGYYPKSDYQPGGELPVGYFEKLPLSKGFIELYDDKCNVVKKVSYSIQNYHVTFRKAYIIKNGFIIYADADLKAGVQKNNLPTERKLKIQYDNHLNVVKTSDIKMDADQNYFFDDMNVYVKHVNDDGDVIYNRDRITICDRNDKIIKTINHNFYLTIYNISSIGDDIIIQGSKFLKPNNSVGYVAAYSKKGEFLWDYQNKELDYGAVMDACGLQDNTIAVFGEANNYGFMSFQTPDHKLSYSYNSGKPYKTHGYIMKLSLEGKRIKTISQDMTDDKYLSGMTLLSNGNLLAFGSVHPKVPAKEYVNSISFEAGYNGDIFTLDKNLNILERKSYRMGYKDLYIFPDKSEGIYTYSVNHEKFKHTILGRANDFKTIDEFAQSQSLLTVLDYPLYFIDKYIAAILVTAGIVVILFILIIFRKKIKSLIH